MFEIVDSQIWKTLESTENQIADMSSALEKDSEVSSYFIEDSQQVKFASAERDRLRTEIVEAEGFCLSVSIVYVSLFAPIIRLFTFLYTAYGF